MKTDALSGGHDRRQNSRLTPVKSLYESCISVVLMIGGIGLWGFLGQRDGPEVPDALQKNSAEQQVPQFPGAWIACQTSPLIGCVP